ncbi:MAG: PAS domain S-box protein [Acidobacteria bacterium]|nr:PAS domain S-box protein [Acidobacteriota bacterium]
MGCLWILLSDKILGLFVKDPEAWSVLQTYKGWFYVFITGGMLFALIRNSVRRTRQIETARIASLERYDELVENASDCIFTLDEQGNFTAANRAVEKTTGYSRAEILKLNFSDILAPEHRDYVAHLLDPQNTHNPSSINEVRIVGKDGRTSFLEISSRPLSTKDHRATIENIARDVTQRHLMQVAIEAAKLRYEKLIETANEGIWTVDADFRVNLVNTKICEMTGFRPEDVLGKSLLDLFDNEDIKQRMNDSTLRSPDGRLYLDFPFTRPDGKRIWLLISSNSILHNGEFQGSLYMATDITERKTAETLLLESEERFRAIFEHSPISSMLIGEGGTVVDCNTVGAQLLGYTREEMRGMHLSVFDIALTADDIGQLDEKVIKQRGRTLFETKSRAKSGEIFNVLVSTAGIRIKGETFGLAMSIDITERKKAEEMVRESEERFRDLFERSAISAMIVDQHSRVVDCNPAGLEMLGYTLEEIKKLTIFDFDDHLSKEEIAELQAQSLEPGKRLQFETKHRMKSGAIKNVLIATSSIRIHGENYTFASVVDITERKKAETLLRESEERFRVLFHRSPVGKMIIAEGGKIVDCNEAGLEMLGYTYDEITRMNIFDIDAGMPKADVLGVEKKIFGNENRLQFETKHRTKSGAIKNVLVAATNLNVAGKNCGFASFLDITEKKQSEEELAARERMISAVNNAAPNIIVLWDVRAGTILYINDRVRHLLGFTAEEMCAMSHEEIFGLIPEEDLPKVWEFNKRLLRARDGEILSYETRFRSKAGETRVVSSRETVFERDAAGRVVKTLSVVEDVTEHKKAVLELERSEARLRKLYRIVSDSNIDPKEKIRRLLELGMREFGLENALLGEVAEQTYRVVESAARNGMLVPGFSCHLSETLCQYVLARNEMIAVEELGVSEWKEHSAYKLFGSEVFIGVPVQVSGKQYGTLCFTGRDPRPTPFTSGDQEFLKLMAQWVSAELTRQTAEEALRHSEEQLVQAQKLESVGRLAGGIAHDFNNMLTAINGYSDLLLARMDDANPLRHNVAEIRKAGERSAALTQQLLAFSRKQILKPEILNVNQTVSEVGSLLQRLIGENILLVRVLDPDLKPIEVDPAKLSQVLVNLVVNARDAMPDGGTLAIETKNVHFDEDFAKKNGGERTGDFVMLAVTDTGVGMSEETLRQLFEPFFTTKDVGKGTGLGLATVYGFIKQSEGYITVDSEPGRGTTFKIFLPCVEIPDDNAGDDDAEERSKSGAETILLVEDEELVRNLGREILESGGYRVIEASGGEEALDICRRGDLRIDLLLTDVVMPEMNGRELWQKLAETSPQIKVLFTSGYTDDMVVRNGITNEEANFLQKPFSIDTLMQKVREVLDADIIQ